jgi:hypothetical protein
MLSGVDAAAKIDFARERADASLRGESSAVLWSVHAVQRLVASSLIRRDVEAALIASELIEDYPIGTRFLPDCLVLGFVAEGEPVHAVVAIDEVRQRILIVTVYRPDPARWSDDFKQRR